MTTAPTRRFAYPPHLDALTGIRGIAAWVVVFFHIRATLAGLVAPWLIEAMSKGYLAVDLFFMLSGFVMWLNYATRLRGGGRVAAIDFYARRLARIWPLHAVLLTIVVLLALVLGWSGHDIAPYPFAQLPLHVLLVQNWGMTATLAWNDPAWSISCELGAYLVFPAVIAAGDWRRLSSGALLGLGCGLLAALYLLFRVAGARSLGHDITHFGLPRCLIEFALGNVLCLLWQRWDGRRGIAAAAGAICAGAIVLGLWRQWPETAFAPLAFASLLMMLATARGGLTRLLSMRVPVYLGAISYATYLAHFPLFTLYKFVAVHGSPVLSGAQLAMFLVLVLGASIVLHHGVELPAQAWLNARIAARRPVPATGGG